MSEEKKFEEDLDWHRKHWETVMANLADTFEREARISDGSVTMTEDRRAGQAEAFRAAAEAVVKASTRNMYLFPEPWIGYCAPCEARP
jgi:hypothetical protein